MIELSGLTKAFGERVAVNQLDLKVDKGEFFGLLGPNGAGKTTTVRMISTLTPKTAGEIRIDGHSMDRDLGAVKRRIGVVPQHNNLESELTAYENLELHGRLYGMSPNQRHEAIVRLLAFAELSDRKDDIVSTFSGGMKRRLMIARALLHGPELLLLDEPTVGLDAAARRNMWDLMKGLKAMGLTVLLTTHYIEEAEYLCDRVGLINTGQLVELDTPKALIARMGTVVVEHFHQNHTETHFFEARTDAAQFAGTLEGSINIRSANLEDVFLKLTHRKVGA